MSSKDMKSGGISRRTLLKRGVTTMPAILTLQSGAALARSSNLIGPAPAGTTDLEGKTLCLDTTSVYPMPNGDKYDLGDPAMLSVNRLADRRYKVDKSAGSADISRDAMCKSGGSFWYNQQGWKEVKLPANGIVVSSTSLHSVSLKGDMYLRDL